MPETLVATVVVVMLFGNFPDAPAPGAENVTLTPDTALLPASRTVTAGALPNEVRIDALCGVVPAFTDIEDRKSVV